MRNIYLLIPFLFFLTARPIHAQQFSFSLAPQSEHIIARPGISLSLPYTLTNLADPGIVTLHRYILQYTDATGTPALLPFYNDDPAFPTITTDDSSKPFEQAFLLSTGSSEEFNVLFTLPADLAAGEYAFAITAEAEPQSAFAEKTQITLQPGIGSRIFLTVTTDGAVSADGAIALFSAQSPYGLHIGGRQYKLFDSQHDIPIILTVANEGTTLFQTSGNITTRTVLPFFRPDEIDLTSVWVPAGTQRTMKTSNTHFASPDAATSMVIPRGAVGIFTVRADLTFGPEGTASAETSIIMFPFTAGMIGLALIIVTYGTIIWRRKK